MARSNVAADVLGIEQEIKSIAATVFSFSAKDRI